MPDYDVTFFRADADGADRRSERITAADPDDAANIAGVMLREGETGAEIRAQEASGAVAAIRRTDGGTIERAH